MKYWLILLIVLLLQPLYLLSTKHDDQKAAHHVWEDPISHTKLNSNLDGAVLTTSCNAPHGPTKPQTEILRILENPAQACNP